MKGVDTISTITTLNTNEILKNEFYFHSYTKISNSFKSKPFDESYKDFLILHSLYQNNKVRPYIFNQETVKSEHLLELTRQEKYPTFPSRINGIFVFLSYEYARDFGKGFIYRGKINKSLPYSATIHNLQESSAHRSGNEDATPTRYWDGHMEDFSYKSRWDQNITYPIIKEVLIDGELIIELIDLPIK